MKKFISLVLSVLMVVGSVFALSSCGNKSYADTLKIVEGVTLATEQYGIAVRKGSGLMKKINTALVELAKDGTVKTIADKYGLTSEVCIDTTATFGEMTDAEKEDWNYVVGQGKMIIGYTDFAPISWKNDAGELVGFDVELAKAVGQKIGLPVEFYLMDWDAKEALIEAKTIDCIWNGMTITPARQEAWEVSIPYLNNKQVAVIRKEDAAKYKTLEDMKDAIAAAESGSAGEECIKNEDGTLNFGKEYKALKSQKDLFVQLNAKAIDVGVMDSVMAGYYMTQKVETENK